MPVEWRVVHFESVQMVMNGHVGDFQNRYWEVWISTWPRILEVCSLEYFHEWFLFVWRLRVFLLEWLELYQFPLPKPPNWHWSPKEDRSGKYEKIEKLIFSKKYIYLPKTKTIIAEKLVEGNLNQFFYFIFWNIC